MEILSKLWVAMTTENETIVDIMSIFLLLIEMPLTLEFFLAVLRIPATLKQKRIYMVITVPIGLLCIFLIPKPYSNIITMIITPFIIMRVFKTSFFKALFAEFLPIICITFLELILTRLFLILFKIDYGGCANIPIYRLSILTCIYLVLFLFYKLMQLFVTVHR